MRILAIVALTFLVSVGTAFGADKLVKWQQVANAAGYVIQMSTDLGVTWTSPGIDVGNVAEYTLLGIPDVGLVLFRIGAYNTATTNIISWQGCWYWGDKVPPGNTVGFGMQ